MSVDSRVATPAELILLNSPFQLADTVPRDVTVDKNYVVTSTMGRMTAPRNPDPRRRSRPRKAESVDLPVLPGTETGKRPPRIDSAARSATAEGASSLVRRSDRLLTAAEFVREDDIAFAFRPARYCARNPLALTAQQWNLLSPAPGPPLSAGRSSASRSRLGRWRRPGRRGSAQVTRQHRVGSSQ